MRIKRFVLALTLLMAFSQAAKAAELCPELTQASHRSQIYGQLLLMGFMGTQAKSPAVRRLADEIKRGRLSGVLFYSRNIINPKQLKSLTKALSPRDALFQPFLAIDEEGGRVQRLSRRKGFSWQTRPQAIVGRGPQAARRAYAQMAREISTAGLNFNLAPVVDLNINAANPVIGRHGRAFSDKPHIVAFYARKFIEEHRRLGVLTALKHFPGHGSSTRDSHYRITDITREWQPAELLPYRALIETGLADGIMTAHLINRHGWQHQAHSPISDLPASLSKPAIHVLRKELAYDGMIFTDDLQMRGIAKKFTLDNAIIKALQAGNDAVLIGNVLDYKAALNKHFIRVVTTAVDTGRLAQKRLEKSFCRIMKAKRCLGRSGAGCGKVL